MSKLRRTAGRVLQSLGFRRPRTADPAAAAPPPLGAYPAAVIALATQRSPLDIVVVGSNDGRYNDPLYQTLKGPLQQRSRVTLIEPQDLLRPFIEDNFAFHSDVKIIEAAVGGSGVLTLHRIGRDHWDRAQPSYAKDWPLYRAPTGVTSDHRTHVEDWVREHMKDVEDPSTVIETIDVTAETLPVLLACAGRPAEIDVLQIDAEGADDNVLRHADLPRTQPAIIFFESKLLDKEQQAFVDDLFATCGYTSFELGPDTIAFRVPR